MTRRQARATFYSLRAEAAVERWFVRVAVAVALALALMCIVTEG